MIIIILNPNFFSGVACSYKWFSLKEYIEEIGGTERKKIRKVGIQQGSPGQRK